MPSPEHDGRPRFPLGRLALAGLAATVIPLLLWGGGSVVVMATAAGVPQWLAPVPAIALGGVMLASTVISMTPTVDSRIRHYAGALSFAAILEEIIVAGAQHYMAVGHPAGMPALQTPIWGAIIGGIPSLQGGLLIHVLAMVFAQHRREIAEWRHAVGEAAIELADVRAAAMLRANERDNEAAHARNLAGLASTAAIDRRREAEEAVRLVAAQRELRDIETSRTDAAKKSLAQAAPRLGVVATNGTVRPSGTTASETFRAWLMEQHGRGRDISKIFPKEAASKTGIKFETAKKAFPPVKRELIETIALAAAG